MCFVCICIIDVCIVLIKSLLNYILQGSAYAMFCVRSPAYLGPAMHQGIMTPSRGHVRG